jgi:hypothetical protein
MDNLQDQVSQLKSVQIELKIIFYVPFYSQRVTTYMKNNAAK